MKTNSLNGIRSGLIALLALGAFGTSLLGGPSPQYWNASAVTAAGSKTARKPATQCPDCKTTTRWAAGERSPAGKGIPAASVASTTHECKGCAGVIATGKGKVQSAMVHGQKCASAMCCK